MPSVCRECGGNEFAVHGDPNACSCDLADDDLFECSSCHAILDIDCSVRVAKGVLVCPDCEPEEGGLVIDIHTGQLCPITEGMAQRAWDMR